MFENFKRIVRSGLSSFWRNRAISIASVLVMTATLFVIGFIFFGRIALESALLSLEKRVDVNVYFLTSASDDDVLEMKKSLEGLPEVASVEFISKEQALENFQERHKDDALTLQAINELEENPLGSVLNIKAQKADQYAGIAKFLEDKDALSNDGVSIIDKVNYYQNKPAIDKLNEIIDSSGKLGFVVALVLIITSVIITFNTIRLAIYMSKDEISVMKLVGASNSYIRGPFVINGIFCGLIASILTLTLFYPMVYKIGPLTEKIFDINLHSYYIANFGQFFLIMVFSGVVLGCFSSFLAVRKYLRI